MGIEAMKKYFSSIGMPVSLKELDIKEEDLEVIADNISHNGTRIINSYVPLGREEVLEILKIAY